MARIHRRLHIWLYKSQHTVENSERNGNTRPPDLPLEKSVCRSKSKLELDMERGSKKEKESIKAVYCHPVYLTYMQSTSSKTLGCVKHKLNLRLPEEISISSDMQMTPPLWKKWRGTKESLDEGERGEWKKKKTDLKLNIQKLRTWQLVPSLDGK